jgi:adenylate kinase
MIITITGSPGTGKTRVAEELGRLTGIDVVSLTVLVRSKKIRSEYDRKMKTYIVDESALDKDIRKIIDVKKNHIIEGLLAHFIKSDLCVVLRTNPEVLEKRLAKRRWTKEKVRENLQAEILDAITIEATGGNRKIMEIDTSKKTPESTAKLIAKILASKSSKKFAAGRVDWMEKYKNYLLYEIQ